MKRSKKPKNHTFPLTVAQKTKLLKIAERLGCAPTKGRTAGQPSIAAMLREIAAGWLAVVHVTQKDVAIPGWWPKEKDGSICWIVFRRRLTIAQETWCARFLRETRDGLGFQAQDYWLEGYVNPKSVREIVTPEPEPEPAPEDDTPDPTEMGDSGSRLDWWPEGESMSAKRLGEELLNRFGPDIDMQKWCRENGVIWNDDGWAERQASSGPDRIR